MVSNARRATDREPSAAEAGRYRQRRDLSDIGGAAGGH